MTFTEEYVPTREEEEVNRLQLLLQAYVDMEEYENAAIVLKKIKTLEK